MTIHILFQRAVSTSLIAVFLLTVSPVLAKPSPLIQVYRQFDRLYKAGKYRQALIPAKRAIKLGKRRYGTRHPTYASLLSNLAGVYRELGHYKKALPLQKRALAIETKAFGHNSPKIGISMNNLAELYLTMGRTKKAETLHERVLALREMNAISKG